jgi:hypothetical protein
MAGTSKEHFWFLNSSNQLRSGETITARTVGTTTIVATFVEPDAVNYPGLYYLQASTGLYDIWVNGVFWPAISPWLHIDSDVLPQAASATIDFFGDGSDGSYTLDGSTQGAVAGLFSKSGSVYTLLKNAYFQNLTINAGVELACAHFQCHVKGTASGDGKITDNGRNGNNGTTGGAGTGGAQLSQGANGYTRAPNQPGGGGAGGLNGVGSGGGNNVATGNALGAQGVQAGTGGAGGAADNGAAFAGGGAGSLLTFTALGVTYGGFHDIAHCYLQRASVGTSTSDIITPAYNGTNSGAGGGGGGRTGTTGVAGRGGGGGGSGENGGNLVCAIATLSGTFTIEVNGGTGGNGGNGSAGTLNSGSGGGGGAGCGGNGGWLVLIYRTKSAWTGSYSIAAGAAGTPGTKGTGGFADGVDGNAATAGKVGLYQEFAV